jgi:membrane associated rhomboid family serine protease
MYPEDDLIDERPAISADEYLAGQKRSIRRRSWWAIGIGSAIVLLHVVGFLFLSAFQERLRGEIDEPVEWTLIFRSIFFILGALALFAGLWGLYYAKKLTLNDLIPSPEVISYLQAGQTVRPIFSFILIGDIILVTIVQMATGLDHSIAVAGFVKPDFWRHHEYWRLLTGAVMHGGLLHIYFNSQALYGFGSMMEQLANRAHLPIVFLLAVLGGGLLSLWFMPAGTSVGASGGIMGMIGYMAIFGYRRKRQLPPDFLKTMLVNIAFIGAIGIIGYQLIDNFAHLGGLLAGGLYGLIQVPRDTTADPRRVGLVTNALGILSIIIFAAICLFTIVLLVS